MGSKKAKFVFPLTMIMLCLFSTVIVSGEEIQSVETQGSIGFTGIYEPIGTPDPTPPDSVHRPPVIEIAKPGGTLPKTNDFTNRRLIWIGICMICFVFILFKQKDQQQKKLKKRK
ncbi:hypothetical protein A5844_001708 [Enterococcus sp. 10A9_DIV0425]|uniref:Gram-positive cocci surface proteins LPxTG domain-containing protein n=1 Tax=Candidatus Enterococcus wittei TaxID=1987383 RepID=A0A242JYK9_9ENTE|nr:LPXTG cell wall anchor domain-containing protein [Enterococcus sp. 10A9_DIV0425]OTP10011.1 hypothetical protein A5844_001708 [Enterococcus sp. 10A9_DIV0425]